jgi:acetyl/propionyl-CoA carboxylase alpha subunit
MSSMFGSAWARDSYRNSELVIAACRQTGAVSVHLFYGFLT